MAEEIQGKKFKILLVEKFTALMLAAFGLVAALAWNDAIRSLFADGGILESVSSGGPWVYAILVTIIAVLAILWIGKVEGKLKGIKESS